MVLSSIQALLSHEALPAPDNVLEVLRLAYCSLRDRATLMGLCGLLPDEEAGAELWVAKACCFEERMHGPEED